MCSSERLVMFNSCINVLGYFLLITIAVFEVNTIHQSPWNRKKQIKCQVLNDSEGRKSILKIINHENTVL